MVVMAAYPQHTLNVNSEDVASPGKKTDLQQHLQVRLHINVIINFFYKF
jgi:hypothetical protein